VIVHVGLLPGSEGLDIRKITLQEIVLTGAYCFTPQDFADTVQALAQRRFGPIDWLEQRQLSEGRRAFEEIDRGMVSAAKVVLRP
jgi:threonine dehydrogenase-like Zn-dependent dehydrogenase